MLMLWRGSGIVPTHLTKSTHALMYRPPLPAKCDMMSPRLPLSEPRPLGATPLHVDAAVDGGGMGVDKTKATTAGVD